MLNCSGVAMLMSPGADHKNERKSSIMLIITIRNNKTSWTSQSNSHKLKGVLFLILDYGSCFLFVLATLLVITFPIFFCLLCIAYACINGYVNSRIGTCQALIQRKSFIFYHYLLNSWDREVDVVSVATTMCIGLMKPWSNFSLLFCLTCQFLSRIKRRALFSLWVFDCDVQDSLLFLIAIISMIFFHFILL